MERVTELAQARCVTKNELFSSAIDLFSGKALIWYRSIKNSITDWDSLVSLLKLNFLPSDYDDKLWDEIKQRAQGRDEPVAIFIAIMETLFSRLARPPAEVTLVKYIKQNLLSQYISQLALYEISTVTELCTLCKKLEEAQNIKNKHRPNPSINVLEPELAYLQHQLVVFQKEIHLNCFQKLTNLRIKPLIVKLQRSYAGIVTNLIIRTVTVHKNAKCFVFAAVNLTLL